MEKAKVYSLDINIPGFGPRKAKVSETMTIGSDSSNDLPIQDFGLAPLHLKLRIQNDILTMTQLGGDDSTKIDGQKLKQGKMYILDQGDKITIDKIKFIIKTTEVEATQEIDPDELKKLRSVQEIDSQEQTDPALSPPPTPFEEKESEEDHEYIEEEEYEYIEEAPEKKSRSGVLKKIKNLFSKKEIKDTGHQSFSSTMKKDKSKSKRVSVERPGPFVRIFSLLIDFLITFLIGTVFTELFNLEPLLKDSILKAQILISPYIEKLIVLIDKDEFKPALILIRNFILDPIFLKFSFIYFVQGILSHLILSKSISYLLLGIKTEGQFIGKRISAMSRFILAPLFFIFLIFDFPSLLKKRTLKEVLTLSKLLPPSLLRSIFGFFILTPLLLFVILLPPLFLEFDSLDNTLPTKAFQQYRIIKKERTFQDQEANILALDLSFKTQMPSDWKFVPTFTKKDEGWNIGLRAIDTKKGLSVDLRKRDDYQLLSQALQWRWLDPSTFFHSEELFNFRAKKESKELDDLLLKNIELSLTLSIDNLDQQLISKGPFFLPYLKLKKSIIEVLGAPSFDSISRHSYKQTNFLILEVSQGRRFLILKVQNNKLISWVIEGKGNSGKMPKEILVAFFKKAKTLEKKFAPRTGELNSFHLLDLFSSLYQGRSFDEETRKNLYQYFIKESHESIIQNNELYQKELVQVFKKIEFYLLKLKPSQDTPERREERDQMKLMFNRVQKALVNKEINFFKINTENKTGP